MKITEMRFYNGAKDKVCRLGLSHLFLELLQVIFETKIFLKEEKDANGAAVVREALDSKAMEFEGWRLTKSGDVDWVKHFKFNSSIQSIMGVEVQVSARSDLIIRDIVHIRNSLQKGDIDIGAIIVPNEIMQRYLPDRTPSIRDAIKYIEEEFVEAMSYPIILIAIEHDGPGEELKKQKRKN